jgi:hypothetical protein
MDNLFLAKVKHPARGQHTGSPGALFDPIVAIDAEHTAFAQFPKFS